MFLENILNHFYDYAIISEYTLYIMSIAMLMTSLVFIYGLIVNKQYFEKNMIRAGVAVRVLMFIGFTIEFAQQMLTYNKHNSIYTEKWDAVLQLVHFLFWAYIIVTGIYYILTFEIKKFRGFFFTFDIAMMSIPLIYGVVLGLFDGVWGARRGLDILLPLSIGCLYLFFQSYWRRNIRFNLAFFLAAGISIFCSYRIGFLKLMFPFACFLMLLGIYNFIFQDIAIKRYRKILLILPLVIILMSNPFYNIWTIVDRGQAYPVTNIFNREVKNVSLADIEKRIRIATADEVNELEVNRITNNNISKAYELTLGKYDINVSGIEGKSIKIISKKAPDKSNKSSMVNEESLIDKTVSILKKMGYSIDQSEIEIKTKDEKQEYILDFFHEFKDGTLDSPKYPFCEVKWGYEGILNGMNIYGSFDIRDYPSVKITEEDIKEKINIFFQTMNENTPDYVINYVNALWRSKVNISCESGQTFEIDGTSGEIIDFYNGVSNQKFDKTAEGEERNRKKAEYYVKNISSFWNSGNLKETEFGKEYIKGQFNFTGYIPAGKVIVKTLIDSEGKLLSFRQDIEPEQKKYSQEDFSVKRSGAIKLIKQRYKPFHIYSVKAALVVCTDDYNNTELKWRVGVVPFLSAEKQYYLVDVKSGKIDAVGSYENTNQAN